MHSPKHNAISLNVHYTFSGGFIKASLYFISVGIILFSGMERLSFTFRFFILYCNGLRYVMPY